jgi:hypothetical protein
MLGADQNMARFANPVNYFGINLELELCLGNECLGDRVHG